MAYQPISETWQLPLEGEALPEDLRFDMKMVVKRTDDNEELARDVAAFANTAGGILLIGAHEHPRDSGILHAYVPISQSEANSVGDALTKALNLCSPKPIAEAKPIALREPGRGYAVAINCDPYAAPPIGVEKPTPSGGHSGDPKWWVFPVRRGRTNHNLRPQELATIMEPRLRRILLVLDRIPISAPGELRRAVFRGRPGGIGTYAIASIDTEFSSMTIRDIVRPVEGEIPLDAMRMIWRSPHDSMYHIALDGEIRRSDNNLLFFPH